MAWVNIPDSDVDQDSPVTVALMTALRDNPGAIAEGADGAPVLSALWHPYDMVEVGDGNDGVFWDHAVDGNTSNIDSPALEDGYEYAIRMINYSGTSSNIRCRLIMDDLSLSSEESIGNYADGSANGLIIFPFTRGGQTQTYSAHGLFNENAGTVGQVAFGDFASARFVANLRIRIGASGTSSRGGKLALYRRLSPGGI